MHISKKDQMGIHRIIINAMGNLQIWKIPICQWFSSCFHWSTWAGIADPPPLFFLLPPSQPVHISTAATPASTAAAVPPASPIWPSISISVSKQRFLTIFFSVSFCFTSQKRKIAKILPWIWFWAIGSQTNRHFWAHENRQEAEPDDRSLWIWGFWEGRLEWSSRGNWGFDGDCFVVFWEIQRRQWWLLLLFGVWFCCCLIGPPFLGSASAWLQGERLDWA